MWYVIQVINGREDVMRERIERMVPAGAMQELFYPQFQTETTDQINDSERKLVLNPDDQYGNKAICVMVPPNEDVLKGRDTLWTVRPPKVDDWLTMVEAAE